MTAPSAIKKPIINVYFLKNKSILFPLLLKNKKSLGEKDCFYLLPFLPIALCPYAGRPRKGTETK